MHSINKVWHWGLLYKLKNHCLSGNLFGFEKLFMKWRTNIELNWAMLWWADIVRCSSRPNIGRLILLIYINDLLEGLKTKIKLFVDNNYILSIANDPENFSEEIDDTLIAANERLSQRKMSFNSSLSKKAAEILCPKQPIKQVNHDGTTIIEKKTSKTCFSMFPKKIY